MPRVFLILGLTILVACSPRGQIILAPQAARVGEVHHIFIGTTRDTDADGSFGSGRSEQVRFARLDVSVPPKRKAGEINWPPRGAKPDPQRHFLTTAQDLYPQAEGFRAALGAELAASGGEAVIFVHGYNNNFSEGVYRIAQLAHDLELPGAVLSYSWPSAAQPLGYVYDRDSALFARDGLESLIAEVSAAGATRILLVAHSMGAGLTMEAMRQASIRDGGRAVERLAGVILISPDIDVDVFRGQAHSMRKLPQPFIIFGSNRDRVLRASALLTGQAERLGSLSDVSRLADLDLTFFDVSEFNLGMGHFTAGDSPALLQLLGRITDIDAALERDRVSRIGLVSGVVLTVQNATEVILHPVARIATEVRR